MKDGESYSLKTVRTVVIGSKRVVTDEVWEHKCEEVDDHGVEHIEAKCVDGTVKKGEEDPESTKGETYNYFQNSHGQRFEYEEIRVNLKDDPIEYLFAEVHAKLKDYSVVPEETWAGKSANTNYTITVGKTKSFMKTDCIEVIRKGVFMNGVAGEFKEDSWYRVSDGQLMAQTTTVDHVMIPDEPEIEILEKLEFRPEKS